MQSKRPFLPVCPLAHKLLNRLTIVTGYADLLAEVTKDNPECVRCLGMIRQAAQDMTDDLINEPARGQDCYGEGRDLAVSETH
jgi:hypothetical protein